MFDVFKSIEIIFNFILFFGYSFCLIRVRLLSCSLKPVRLFQQQHWNQVNKFICFSTSSSSFVLPLFFLKSPPAPLFLGFYITAEGSIPLVDMMNRIVQLYKIREMTRVCSFMFNFHLELLSKLPIYININTEFIYKETCASFPLPALSGFDVFASQAPFVSM